jgi:hypothetical protein
VSYQLKIEDQTAKAVKFSEVGVGDVFQHKYGGITWICMKVDSDQDGDYDAIDLSDGEWIGMGADDECVLLEATLTVKGGRA